MTGSFDNTIITRIQQATDIVDLVSEYLRLDKKGKEFVGLCPFHQDHRPSMYVSPQKQIFKCFACGAGGDVIKFVQMKEGLSFGQSLQRLAERAGIEYKPARKKEREPGEADPGDIARVNKWAARYFRANLEDSLIGREGREYLSSRGFNENTIKVWGIGLACPGWSELMNKARAANIPESLLVQAGLIVKKEGDAGGYDKFRKRVMFPIMDSTSRVIGFGGRTLGDDPAKYMNSPATPLFDKSNCLYGLDRARHSIGTTGTAVVMEGYTDVIMAHQFAINNVVATLGTSFTPGHARLLRRYAKSIVLVFDSDEAGVSAANRALDVCLEEKIDIRLAFVPQGKDPCDYLLEAGPEALTDVINKAVDVMKFKWDTMVQQFDGSDSVTDKNRAVREYLEVVAKALRSDNLDAIEAGILVNKLAGIIGMEVSKLQSHLKRLAGGPAATRVYNVTDQRVVSVGAGLDLEGKAQSEILEALIAEPSLYSGYRDKLDAEDFTVPYLAEIARALFGMLDDHGEINLSALLANIESTEASSWLTGAADSEISKGDNEKRLADSIEVLKNSAQQRKNDEKMNKNADKDEYLYHLMSSLRSPNKRNPGLRI